MRVVSYYPDALHSESGTSSAVRAWSAALAGQGVDVRLVVDAEALALPAPDGVELAALRHVGRGRLRRPRSCGRALAGADLLVLHGAASPANILVGRAARADGTPYIVTGHGAFDPQALSRRRRRKAVWNAVVERRHLNRTLAVHLYFAEERTGLSALGVHVPVVTAPNGCTVNGRRWSGGDELVWLGRFDVETKGLDLLLEGMRRTPVAERPRLRLHGPDWRGGKGLVMQEVSRLGLDEWVAVEDPVYGEAKWSLLARSAGLVHPSRWDACPTTVLEAASIGAPILTTPHPLGRWLAARGGAVVVDAGADALAGGLRAVRAADAAGLGARAAEAVREDLAWPSVAASWLAQVEALLAGEVGVRRADVEALLPLLGEKARAFALPETVPADGDVDCAVERPDPLWPLRLGDGWRLCQSLAQDAHNRRWVLERDGELLSIDALDDPDGLGRDLFPTGLAADGDGPLAPTCTRAAYAAAKAIRKGDVTTDRWHAIGELAREDEKGFRAALAAAMGSAGTDVADTALRVEPPSHALQRRARKAGLARRARHPGAAVRVAARVAGRLVRPTGLTVVVAGPDGSGKSSLAAALPGACGQLFRRSLRLHGRPGVLPRPGALLRRPRRDPATPHAATPHGRGLSSALIVYYWLDFLIGQLVRIRPATTRSSLVVLERGWWDLVVDPRRYRLDPPAGLVRALGAVLPRPDLVLVLEAPAATLAERKAELPTHELDRQRLAWQHADARTVAVDATAPAEEVLAGAREEIVRVLNERALARLGAGWTSLAGGRWQLPRGPRRAAHAALAVYQPVTVRSRISWELARAFARVGGFRLLPRRAAPPAPVRRRLAPHLPPRTTFAVARGNVEGRFVTLAVGERGAPGFVAKLAVVQGGAAALQREADALADLAGRLPEPLSAPKLLARERGMLLLAPVAWRPRLLPWRLPAPVAHALGRFAASGHAHGDCAPWNLLSTPTGWALVDWEEAGEATPFTDVLHYLVRANSHLGRPSLRALRAGFAGRGWVGKALRAYVEGAGIDRAEAARAVDSLAPDDEIDDRRARRAIAAALGR